MAGEAAIFAEDYFGNHTDPDLVYIATDGNYPVSDSQPYLPIVHDAQPISAVPTIYVDGVPVELSAVGEGGMYTLNRLSETQSVLQINPPKECVITIGTFTFLTSPIIGQPIGIAVIGTTNIVA